MKKIILTIILIFSIPLTGCGLTVTSISKSETNSCFLECITSSTDISGTYRIEEYRDTETGVHYFINFDYMCPRYNADGTLYTD